MNKVISATFGDIHAQVKCFSYISGLLFLLYLNVNLVYTVEKEKMKTFNIFPHLEEKFPDYNIQIRINEELDTIYKINSKDGMEL